MCDCYTEKCTICGCKISIHIADYCTSRDNITAYCHRCAKKIKSIAPDIPHIIREEITHHRQVEGGKKGAKVLILCSDPKAYGIHLN